MKTRFFWACVMALACVLPANAYNDNDARNALRTTIDRIDRFIADLGSATADNSTTFKSLKSQIDEIRSSVRKLQESVDGLEKDVANLKNTVRKGDQKGDQTDIKANVALWITIPIVMVICSILCLTFWPRKSRVASLSLTLSDKHKCPRCGWKHDPGDTVCKNPNCKTQF